MTKNAVRIWALPKPISKEERAVRQAIRQVDAEKAMTEHQATERAFFANRERLKAERLTRELAGTPAARRRRSNRTKKPTSAKTTLPRGNSAGPRC
jgi:uncharacterized protein YdaU (DUF1376 family)